MNTMSSPGILESLRALLKQRGAKKELGSGGSQGVASRRLRGRRLWSWLSTQGLQPGTVMEWCESCPGSGSVELALLTMQRLLPAHGRWLWVDDPGRETYPAGLAERGVALERLLLVRPRDSAEALWAIEQGLRSRGVDAVYSHVSQLSPVAFRRLKLAAETGHCRCLLLRGPEALRTTSWADLRLLISALPSAGWNRRRLQVEVLKVRNGVPGELIQVEIDDESTAVYLVSELADSTDLQRAAGA